MFRRCDTEYNLNKHLITFLQESPFFAELSRQVRKVSTQDMPTAGVTFDPKRDDIVLYWNPDFFAKMGDDTHVLNVITHEYYHLVFGHVASRRRKPHQLWNIATDLAINSIICSHHQSSGARGTALPDCALIPGVRPRIENPADGKEIHPGVAKLADLIAKFPPMMASEWYFNRIQEEANEQEKNGDGSLKELVSVSGGEVVVSIDEHGGWDEIPEDMREYVESRVKEMVRKAAKSADAQANGWGNIPASLREEIRASIAHVIDWKAVLKQFVGSTLRGDRTTSIKRINRKYPYVHPGAKRSYMAKLLVAIDQSGSVSDEMLADFFGELSALARRVTIDILPFDCSADVADVYTWNKGTRIAAKRTKCGGTDFDAPTEVLNDPRNRGRWDGCIICTDGQAPVPGPSRVKRGWVLGKGQKLAFDSNEVQVLIDDAKIVKGAWR